MSEHQVKLIANEGIFRGLAKQNMLFHQCVGELVDNAIAACALNKKFRVDIMLQKVDDDYINLYICDNSNGMTLDILRRALQLGESATQENRLNEHGFGLKNSLATLSGGNGIWQLWTKDIEQNKVYLVEGPFKQEMTIKEIDALPVVDFLPVDLTSIVSVKVKLSFVRTVQGRGAPASDLITLRDWLVEHLGVLYRGYLEQDTITYDHSGVIIVSVGNNSVQVPPIPVPLGNMSTVYPEVELGGKSYKLTYRYGSLDEVKRDSVVRGSRARYYYQANIPTQGIDIRLGKRVIATRQFETIWKISRHNDYNDFVGELLIPDNVERGILATINNKTDFNLDDINWEKVFEKIRDIKPQRGIREASESRLRTKWVEMLKATSTDDTITTDKCVWPTGTKIDVYRKTNEKIIIYELKVGMAQPIHLYQLKMYWDGLVILGEQPSEAVLLAEAFSTAIEEMANLMNTLNPPNSSEAYNFKIEKHKDKGLG